MVRLLAVADLHLGPTHLCGLQDQERAVDAIVDACSERDIRLVLIGGDLFHRNRPDPATIALAGHFFSSLALHGVTVVMARGNHDPDAAEIVRYFRGTVLVPSEPGVASLDAFGLAVDIAVMPYLPDAHVRAQHDGRATKEEIAHLLTQAAHEILEGFLARRRPGVPLVFLGHGTVAGSETSTGYSMGFRGGTEWRLAVEDLVRFDLAIAGHVHRHQSPAPNVIVPGSLLPLDFSETERKGVIVAELAGAATWEFVPTPAPRVMTFEVDGGEQLRSLVGFFESERSGRGVASELAT